MRSFLLISVPNLLHRDGQEVALQLLGTEDGRLDAGDELRLYAPDPGDRWNTTATYWLTYENQPGRRIERRDRSPGVAPQRTTGHEAGSWQPRTIYDSTLPGPDGDQWFADTLRSGPEQAIAPITIPLTATLPLAAVSVTITFSGNAATPDPHQMEVMAESAMALQDGEQFRACVENRWQSCVGVENGCGLPDPYLDTQFDRNKGQFKAVGSRLVVLTHALVLQRTSFQSQGGFDQV